MVDVGSKPDTHRVAVARGEVHMQPATLELIRTGGMSKGDVLTVAQIAGIMAAKRTAELIPLCHPLPLTQVQVELALDDSLPGVAITATVSTVGKTGVEMEALTAVSVADGLRHGQIRRENHAHPQCPPGREAWRAQRRCCQ